MTTVLLALVFLSELAAWAAIGVATYTAVGGGAWGWGGAVLAVAVAITAWGRWAAPRSSAPPTLAVAVKILVFGAAVAGLLLTGRTVPGIALAALVVVAHIGVAATR